QLGSNGPDRRDSAPRARDIGVVASIEPKAISSGTARSACLPMNPDTIPPNAARTIRSRWREWKSFALAFGTRRAPLGRNQSESPGGTKAYPLGGREGLRPALGRTTPGGQPGPSRRVPRKFGEPRAHRSSPPPWEVRRYSRYPLGIQLRRKRLRRIRSTSTK